MMLYLEHEAKVLFWNVQTDMLKIMFKMLHLSPDWKHYKVYKLTVFPCVCCMPCAHVHPLFGCKEQRAFDQIQRCWINRSRSNYDMMGATQRARSLDFLLHIVILSLTKFC